MSIAGDHLADLQKAQVLLSKMMNITAHWHSDPNDCEKCRTVEEVVRFLQDTGYGAWNASDTRPRRRVRHLVGLECQRLRVPMSRLRATLETAESYTDWYAPDVKPERPGVYEVGLPGRFHAPDRVFRYWDGKHWHWAPNVEDYAQQIVRAPRESNLIVINRKEDWREPWRGLTEEAFMMAVNGKP